jgi:DNA-binding response OmpR family regulator
LFSFPAPHSHQIKTTPVIILTNLGEEEAPKGLRDLGIHSYIVKANLTPRQVTSRVKEALGLTD